ncbi:hypothetical protein GLOTRDRAFT_134585 [Gloeophyllum trabeum ATCC 11539]|uniref:Uncharacterized protein n=1 Tax=Gloeophyllum trabeum (strain ATCC 11539 / FP-39264 / Madison 617) TaxID=670483 RepID=S7RBN6_GLOTA|nr:uncharacterized protein GLOTRDRAFT_134585 [Gloeophyllum trabeum ATCC 11539]EPQ49809.1 hypothetical protein GLOTRDRAFT_134585 [Gloeophyllum trabeum ATCC 11539]
MAPTAQLPGSPPRKRSRKAATDDNVTRPLSAHSHVHWGIKRPRFEVKLDSGNDLRIPKRERYSPSVDESPSKISASIRSDAKADSDPALCAAGDDVVAAGTRSSRHPPVSQKTVAVDSEAEPEERHGSLGHGDDKEPRADDGASILPQGTSGTPAASVTIDAKEGDLDATVISGNSRVDVKSASDPVGGPHKDTPTTHLTSLSSTESSAVRPDGDNAAANAAKDASVNPSAHLDLLGSPSDDTQGVSTPTASRPDQGPAVIPDSSGHLTDKSRSIERE